MVLMTVRLLLRDERFQVSFHNMDDMVSIVSVKNGVCVLH